MKPSKINFAIGFVLFLIGMCIGFIAITITPITSAVVSGTVSAVSQGAPIQMFQYYINGLLAGGHISIISKWIVQLMGFLSVLLMYSGSHCIINRNKSKPYLYWFKLSYWKEFQPRVKYKAPVKIKAKRG